MRKTTLRAGVPAILLLAGGLTWLAFGPGLSEARSGGS